MGYECVEAGLPQHKKGQALSTQPHAEGEPGEFSVNKTCLEVQSKKKCSGVLQNSCRSLR